MGLLALNGNEMQIKYEKNKKQDLIFKFLFTLVMGQALNELLAPTIH